MVDIIKPFYEVTEEEANELLKDIEAEKEAADLFKDLANEEFQRSKNKLWIDNLYVMPDDEKREKSFKTLIEQTRKGDYSPTLSGYVFVNKDFSDSVIKNIKFVHCVFKYCVFENIISNNCDFENCFFEGCEFSSATIEKSRLVDCAIWKTNFIHCMINSVYITYNDGFVHSAESTDKFYINKYNKLVDSHLTYVIMQGSEVKLESVTSEINTFKECLFKFVERIDCKTNNNTILLTIPC